ncbi:hypothetical protein [Rodentibacter mrazii]|nr:hypothetical protein [Rodentibacter mrazii]
MTFTVEIGGETVVQHQIEEQAEKRSYFSQERKLTKEIVNRMNEFHSERWLDARPWGNFKTDKNL